MKPVDYNYCAGYEGRDADSCNPDLRVAMNKLYGEKFDFGIIKDNKVFWSHSDKIHCSPDGNSSYTSLYGNYIGKMPFRKNVVENFDSIAKEIYNLSCSIAGEFFFPCERIDNKWTINQTRGMLSSISDRIDLTLRDIKYFYDEKVEDYPLKDVLNRYKDFFSKFGDFKGYVDYCLLQDFCKENYEVDLWKDEKGLPKNEEELVSFWKWSIEKLESRAKRIAEKCVGKDL